MASGTLRQALQNAGLERDELADILRVDPRTVRRWLAGGTPYTRHRAQLARALDTTEHKLWPHLAQTAQPGEPDAPPPLIDALTGYADADAADNPTTENLIADARERIDLMTDTSRELLEPPGLTEQLLAKARDGCRVRILVSEPGHQSLTPLLSTSGIEIRRSEVDERPVVHRADDDTLAWITLTTDEDHEQPILLHLRRDQAPGLFARLAEHYQHVWEHGEPLETADDIEYYLAGRGGDDEEHEPEPGAHHSTQLAAPRESTPPDTPHPTPQRRWPGRQA